MSFHVLPISSNMVNLRGTDTPDFIGFGALNSIPDLASCGEVLIYPA